MKKSHIVAAAALAFAASQASAVSVSVSSVSAGNAHQAFASVPGSYTVSGFTDYNASIFYVATAPTGTGSFSAASNNSATVAFSSSYTGSFTFEWGTPSVYDTLSSSNGFVSASNSAVSYGSSISGSSMLIGGANPVDPATGNSQYDKFVTLGDLAGQTLTFTSTQAAFEVAVAAVPEPETYALMLAGLGAIGWVARRRKAV